MPVSTLQRCLGAQHLLKAKSGGTELECDRQRQKNRPRERDRETARGTEIEIEIESKEEKEGWREGRKEANKVRTVNIGDIRKNEW